jgi:hypothetical protein
VNPMWWFAGMMVSLIALIATLPFIHSWAMVFLLPEAICLFLLYRATRVS